MPSVLRRYDDDGAPLLNGNVAGSLVNVLRTVLVDGYGTQPGMGWTVEYEDAVNNVIVFRQGGTNPDRPHIRIADNYTGRTTTQIAYVCAYDSMSDANTGIGPCPPSEAGEYRYILKANGNYSEAMPWVIIGDELGFWLLIRAWDQTGAATNNGSLYWVHYIGDWDSNFGGNSYNFCTILSHSNGYGYFGNTPSWLTTYVQRHPVTQAEGAVAAYPNWHYTNGNSMIGYNSTTYDSAYTSPINGRYIYYPLMMFLTSWPYPTWGTIPGMYNMMWRRESTGYYMNAEERTEFYDIYGDKKMFVFAIRQQSYPYNSLVARGSILIGEGFRNAY